MSITKEYSTFYETNDDSELELIESGSYKEMIKVYNEGVDCE